MINHNKLMTATKWLQREFEEGSFPDRRTLKRWIESGKLKGKIVEGKTYVYSGERWGVQSEVSQIVSQLIQES